MALESRSGHKTLLKLLLEKTNEVLTQSVNNELEIKLLRHESQENREKLILIIKQLELMTGEEDYN